MRDTKNKWSFISNIIQQYKTNWKSRLTIRLLIIGLLYGYISALNNQNPYYPVRGNRDVSMNQRSLASNWKPSIFWLPSYILCKLPPGEPGIGITCTKSGYLFRSDANRILYIVTSTFLGGIMGLTISVVVNKRHKDNIQKENQEMQ
jgi:hypothetical protein